MELISASTLILKNSRTGRAASSIAMIDSARATVSAIFMSMAPRVVAQDWRSAPAWPTCSPAMPSFTKCWVHVAAIASANAPCP